MRVAIAYIFPNLSPKVYEPMARRFSIQYLRNPPGASEHELYVISNGGGRVTERQEKIFDPLVPNFIYHDNIGRDIGAFQMAARTIPCDLLVCIGSPARPRSPGWLDIMVQSVENHGPGLYGVWGFHSPTPHIRTTVWWISPQILNAYPIQVGNDQRYHFEHSHESITAFSIKKGFPVLQVTNRGVFSIERWHHVELDDSPFIDQHGERSLGWVDDGGGW